MTTQYILKNLKDPIGNREAASNNYVDNLINNPSIIKTVHMLTSMNEISITLDLFRLTVCQLLMNT